MMRWAPGSTFAGAWKIPAAGRAVKSPQVPVGMKLWWTAFSKLRLLTQLKSPIFSFPQISQTNAIP
jgi:hypothetical protein